ncbi:MAG: ASKHA domain-containing protein, partial [Opitutaceae bacterium]|jgi:uncharacterized 2Fe-2S/4Fe-4S cluster protein (DUF4445 family)|nr:ASKHA domain-containing protein [Opitutaceae bacterium]
VLFRSAPIPPAQPLSALLAAHHHPLNTRCGGRGLCRACEVRLAAGSIRSLDTNETVHAPATLKACRHTLDDPAPTPHSASIEIPARALLRHKPSIVSNFRIKIPRSLDPLAPPPASPGEPWLGAAVDLGTTTVALLLCDLRTGEILSTATAFNAQVRHGEDVLTRVNLCAADPRNVPLLQSAAAGTIRQLLEKACASASADPAHVRSLVVAGNTVMLHLLAGVDPSPIGVFPFTPPFLGHRRLAPAALGLSFGGNAPADAHLLPGPAAYVGADLSAGILVTGLLHDDGPALLVDVGTNGEIILKHGPRLLGTATAAGPAFEGAGLAAGMSAVEGVIESIRFSRAPFTQKLSLIGGGPPGATGANHNHHNNRPHNNPQHHHNHHHENNPHPHSNPHSPHNPHNNPHNLHNNPRPHNASVPAPAGICGSAYIDFLAEGRRAGLLNEHGRFAAPPPPGAESAFVTHDGARAFVLDPRGRSGPVLVTEPDIARLLQAKAAVAAGIVTLLDLAGLAPADIRTLHLAGGFGLHLDLDNAIACGLLPGFGPEQIEVVGNTALGGALAVLQDRNLLPEIARACALMENIELNLQPAFENTYIDQLALP